MQPASSAATATAASAAGRAAARAGRAGGVWKVLATRLFMAGSARRRGRRRRPVELVRVHLALAVAALEEPPHDDEEYRHEAQRERGRRDHAAHRPGADRALARRAGAGRDDERQHAE